MTSAGAGRRSLLADATARLRDAGVASPEHDAAELLAHVLGTTRGGLVLVDEVSPGHAEEYDASGAPADGPRAAAAPAGPRLVPARRAGGRARRLRAASGDRAARRLGGRAGREPATSRSWSTCAPAPGPSPRPSPTRSRRPGCTRWSWTRPPTPGRCATSPAPAWTCAWATWRGVRRPRGCRRRGRLQPAVHPAGGLGERRRRGPRPRPAPGAVLRAPTGSTRSGCWSAGPRVLLRPGGVLGFEHADLQGDSAPAVLAGTGRWVEVRDHPDLAGRPRFTTARLAP